MERSPSDRPGLKRSLGLLHVTSLVVGTIIGASIFVQPSEITRHVPTLTGVLLVWTASGLLTVIGALVCAELASAFPDAGGPYVFLGREYGPVMGFLWGWAMFWSVHSGIIAAMAMVFARYAAYFAPLDEWGMRGAAVAAILALSAINYVGVAYGSRLQTAFTIVKVAAILLLVTAGFLFGAGGPSPDAASPAPAAAGAALSVDGFLLAMVAGLFAFGGWHMATYAAEETRDPRRTLPRALAIGTLVVTVCYIALNAAYLSVLPLATVVSSTRVAADAAVAMMGGGGATVMSTLVVFSVFGALSGVILAGPRAYYAMARDGALFSCFAAVHPRFQTPHRAIALQAAWASVLAATGTYRDIFSRVIYTEWIFFALMALGLFRLRRRPDYAPMYRVWGYPLLPALFVVASLVVVINRIWTSPTDSLIGLGLVAAGAPVYWIARRREGAYERAGGGAAAPAARGTWRPAADESPAARARASGVDGGGKGDTI